MKTNYPLDMSPADMADELAEHHFKTASVEEVLEFAKSAINESFSRVAEANPKAIEKMYYSLIGEEYND
jgi:hypothetical protein